MFQRFLYNALIKYSYAALKIKKIEKFFENFFRIKINFLFTETIPVTIGGNAQRD